MNNKLGHHAGSFSLFLKKMLHFTDRRPIISLLIILTISFVPKLILWQNIHVSDPSRFMTRDSTDYHNSAVSLVRTGNFSVSSKFPRIPETIRTPGYPAFLATVYAIFSEQPSAGILVQLFISLGTIVLTYGIAREIWGVRIALLAATILVADIVSFSYSLLLLSETLFTFFICLTISSCLCFAHKDQKNAYAFITGFFLAIATVVRPIAYYLIFCITFLFLCRAITQGLKWRQIFVLSLSIILPFVLVVGGWQLRNYYLTGSAEFSHIVGINMLFYRGAGVLALREDISLEEAGDILAGGPKKDLIQKARLQPEKHLGEIMKKQGMAFIIKHPFLYLKVVLRGVLSTLIGSGEHRFFRLLGIPTGKTGPLGDFVRLSPKEYVGMWIFQKPLNFFTFLLAILYLGTIYAGNVYWLRSSLKVQNFRFIHILIFTVCFYLLLISAGPEAGSRFRLPIMPFLSIYAAYGLNGLLFNISKSKFSYS